MPIELSPDILGQHEHFLIYGDPGTGKTETALTAPGPIYVLCIGPVNELKTRYSKHYITRDDGRHNKKKIYYDEAKEEYNKGEITDNPVGLDIATDKLDTMLEMVRKGDIEKPETLIVDNATVLESYMMNKAMVAGYELANNKETTALKRMRDYGIIKPGDNDFGSAQSLMGKFVNWIQELPYHIVFIAHEYTETKPKFPGSRERDTIGVYPLFVGKQRTEISRAFDNVWRTTVSGSGRTSKYEIQTQASDVISAKTRVGGILDEVITAPALDRVIEVFQQYPKEIQQGIRK